MLISSFRVGGQSVHCQKHISIIDFPTSYTTYTAIFPADPLLSIFALNTFSNASVTHENSISHTFLLQIYIPIISSVTLAIFAFYALKEFVT